jgi:hypothetical protein
MMLKNLSLIHVFIYHRIIRELIVKNLVLVHVLVWHRALKPVFLFIFQQLLVGIIWGTLKAMAARLRTAITASGLFIYHRIIRELIVKNLVLVHVLIWHRALKPGILFFVREVLIEYPKQVIRSLFYLIRSFITNLRIFVYHKVWRLTVVRLSAIFVSFMRYKLFFPIWIFFRYRSYELLLFLAFPIRKLYWFIEHQYEKRILKRFEQKDA